MGVVEGDANAFMAAYNKVNGIPCTVQPFLRAMTMKASGDWTGSSAPTAARSGC